MKKNVNLIFLIVFIGHFTLLAGYFTNNFDTIAHAKFSLRVDRPLDIENTVNVRDFKVKENDKAEKITVLMYHRVIDNKDLVKNHYDEDGNLHGTIVTLYDFEAQMQYLKDKGFKTLTLPEFQAYMKEDIAIPTKSVLITFDDGFKDNYINAYPVLKKHNFNASIFLITGGIDRNPRDYDPADAQFLSVKDINKSLDVFSYHGHADEFHKLDDNGVSYLISKEYEDVKADIQSGYETIGDSSAFAYPYGEYNKSTLEILKELDTDMAFTIKDGMASPGDNMLEIPRRGVYPGTTLDIFDKLITYE
ncbi:polysaccharide deacetylase family protein [Pradoshia sp. D12]|uniref:polysaccharide deacetylase family protein n=1 Tax=Bacillaceae TaxID=186817 RepID=UPI00080AEA60|nr:MULTISPECIES: polysaccharide deacetylase family protein [Bacillaceae]OCA81136.1 hypothetical protein A8L44_15740 [Bacillus sp. FJAT-27986]QFK73068.1 polysaccharide deacetylase family protein [Pradoshia sp. D12]TPF72060.1 polysaccharide deacetylase family protein [Bacillus sp. D12]